MTQIKIDSATDDSDFKTVDERLLEEHEVWLKSKRSGDMSRQMRDARQSMNDLLDEKLLLRREEQTII